MITKSDALSKLCPNGGWIQDGDTTIWLDGYDPVSDEEIALKVAELEYQEEVNEYQRQRAAEYPPYADQFDKIYHSGVTAWKSQIKVIKDKYPKQTMDTDELQTRQDKAIFDLQTKKYLKATERLSQYILLEGREEITEDIVVGTREVINEETGEVETVNVTENVVIQTAVEPLEENIEVTTTDPETLEVTTETVRNPLIIKDEEERAAAQAIVDATPQSVIDAINN